MVHVEHGDVDHPRIGGGEVFRPLDADVLERAARGILRTTGISKAADAGAVEELVLAEK
jgi:hypothetical protein